jgi:putative flippase GtrA
MAKPDDVSTMKVPMPERQASTTDHTPKGLRHWLGFGASGGIAFITDVTTLKLLVLATAMPVNGARFLSISVAMVAGWLTHRRFTFNIQAPPSLKEFTRYAGVAWVAAAINYAVFIAILWVRPTVEPIIAAALSAGVAMVAAYFGMRFAAFRKPPTPT